MLSTPFEFQIVFTPKPMHHTESTTLVLSLQKFPRTTVAQCRSVSEVVIANLVSRSFDLRNQLGVAQGSFADEEESCRSLVPMKNF